MLDPEELPLPDDAGEPPPKKPPSPAKVEASRSNPRGATGPKTEQGKKNSSRNPRKHGLLTKDIVITTGPGKEDQAEFDRLLADLRDFHQPMGIEEYLAVQELADSYWRSARALRSERGEVTLNSEIRPQNPELTELDLSFLAPLSDAEARYTLLTSSRGLNCLLQLIEDMTKAVQSLGHLPLESRRWLPPAEIWNGGAGKRKILAALKREIAELTRLKAQTEKDELDKSNAQRDCAAIPGKEALDRIYRYETSNRRHRYKVQARLDQLQARRKEDAKAGLKTGGQTEAAEKN
jgi:hypothetical protein